MRIVSQTKNDYGLFLLHADEGNLTAVLSCLTVQKPVPQEVFQAVLRKYNLRRGLLSPVLARAAATLAAGQPLPATVIARGTPPTIPGSMHLSYAPGAAPMPSVKEDPSGVLPENPDAPMQISNVRTGDVIARVSVDTEEHPGIDVFGNPIPPSPAWKKVVRAGKHVVFDAATRCFRSEIDGQVLLEDGELSVDPILHLRRDHPPVMGKIVFVGYVRIDGEVPEGARIEAEKGIRIGGVAEGCELITQGNIEIVGGMTGRGSGRVQAGKNVRAHYLKDVTVEAGGDVKVTKEVLNAKVFALGRADLETASVVGGEVVALGGICAKVVSSPIDVPTILIAGIDYRVREELLGINRAMVRDERRQQELLNRVGPMLKRAKGIPPPLHVREEIDDLMMTIRQLQRNIQVVREQSAAIMDGFMDAAIPCISVTGTLHLGARMTVGRVEGMVAAKRVGPVSVVQDDEAQAIAVKPGLLVKELWAEWKRERRERAAAGVGDGEI